MDLGIMLHVFGARLDILQHNLYVGCPLEQLRNHEVWNSVVHLLYVPCASVFYCFQTETEVIGLSCNFLNGL